jgi:prolyl-tRNA synthetase
MKATKLFIKTYKEAPSNADSKNQSILIRASMIYQNGNGLFTFLPLGLKVIQKIESIVREEMNRIGCNEMIFPFLSAKDLWKKSGKWDGYGPELMRIKDRKDREYALVPTAEVEFLNLIVKDIKSYKDFPIFLYQIGAKFRDEIRPRFGLLRSKQFIMKDAYSFHSDQESLDEYFELVKGAYINVFKRLGFDFRVCEADSGTIGGDSSLEFIVLTDAGEADIVSCKSCGYTANVEKAKVTPILNIESRDDAITYVKTENISSIEDASHYLNSSEDKFLKTLIIKTDNRYLAIVLKGNRFLNENKLASYLKEPFNYANDEEIESLGLFKGYIGPMGLDIQVIADDEVIKGSFYSGANKKHFHIQNLTYGRDWTTDLIMDLKNIESTDKCFNCNNELSFMKGIEVGHIFKLGESYAKSLDSFYIDRDGKNKYIKMSSYGIGISRVLGALVEQNSTENSINLPKVIEPFELAIVISDLKDKNAVDYANNLYLDISKTLDVLIDDRPLSIGYKFKDLDLIGVSRKLVIGKHFKDNKLEFKNSEETIFLELDISIKDLINLVRKN